MNDKFSNRLIKVPVATKHNFDIRQTKKEMWQSVFPFFFDFVY